MKPVIRPARSLLTAALVLACAPLSAQTFSQTVFFGDSLTDTGTFRPGLIQVGGPQASILGRFTTNPDLIYADFLADYYGTDATPANQGGDNYAVGGARSGVDAASPFGPVPSVFNQVDAYLAASGGVADSRALYTVWAGANDLFAISGGADAQTTLATAITAQIGAIGSLQVAGARYVLVPNIPDLGLTPAFLAQGPAAVAGGTQLAIAYNSALYDGLAGAGLRVIPLDTFNLLTEIVADPGAYGFSNVTGTACQPQITAQSLTCNPGTLVAADAADTYVFADGVHPTGAAHEILAQAALSVLEAPRQIAVLPHSVAVVGRARAERVAAQMADGHRGNGARWWADVRGDFQRYDGVRDEGMPYDGVIYDGELYDGLLYDGIGPSLTIGVDRASGNLVYGGFAGYGRQQLDWGQRRGSFDQSDASIGGYLGWRGQALWIDGQVSYSRLSFDLDRSVQLGPATRTHSGSPDGSNLGVRVGAGWNFQNGALSHGPVLALLAQQIEVDGYAENSAQSTALAYPDQSFDSMIGSLGWQASYAVNPHLRPYARLTVDREFEDMPEEAFARSLSIPGSAPYAVPGLAFDDQYGTLVVGARTRLLEMDANIGVSATVGQEGGNDARVFASFGGSF